MKLSEQLKLQKDIEVPWNVWRFLGDNSKVILIRGDQASFGEDFGSLEELRKVVEFYVEHLNGKVTWKK